MNGSTTPPPVRAAKWAFWVLAAVWVILGINSFINLLTGEGEPKMYMWVVTGLMFANALVMVWLGWGIGRQLRCIFYLAVAYMVMNIILTITDDFGLADLIYLILSIGLLGLLLATSRYYPKNEVESDNKLDEKCGRVTP